MNQKIKNDVNDAELKIQLDDNTKNMVLSMLSTKPQSRFVLAKAIGISERTFRQAVHQLRLDGQPVISVSFAKGYKLGSASEARMTALEMRSRAYDLLRTARALEGIDPDQLSLDEVMAI